MKNTQNNIIDTDRFYSLDVPSFEVSILRPIDRADTAELVLNKLNHPQPDGT